jgi:ribosomal protein S18 acetylase RimI-like enzyme
MNQTMPPEILPAGVADASEIATLVNSAYRGDSSRQGWTTEADLLDGTRTDAAAIEDLIKKPGYTLLKYSESGKILACVELHRDGQRLYLGMLTVSPQLQGQGIGKAMMRAAEHHGRSLGCRAVYMTVISIRKELIDWYQRHGYRPTGERKPFAFSDPRFGQPKQPLEFIVLEKPLA